MLQKLEAKNKLNDIQHGFRPGRSCLSQLLSHFDRILSAVESSHQYHVIYTDYAKAFDKCDFAIICRKMNSLGINHDIGRWIQVFLTQSTFSVTVNRTISSEVKVKSSVPQGTVLAPLLFLILINDININVIDCDVTTFADDTKISKVIKWALDKVILQSGLTTLCEWTDTNNMEFNEDKFSLVKYSTTQTNLESTYQTPNGTNIEETNEIKDLGILMNNNMTFNSQIIKAAKKAKQKTGWITRTFKTREKDTLLTPYKTLVLESVLPHVEYLFSASVSIQNHRNIIVGRCATVIDCQNHRIQRVQLL